MNDFYSTGTTVDISFVIPVFNEEATIGQLASSIHEVSTRSDLGSIEIIFVDDGSTDGTWRKIREIRDSLVACSIRGYRFRRNFGKAAALSLGFEVSKGGLVVTMDGDLQDDPEEITQLLAKIDEGFDLVSGWKRIRNDPPSKTFPSRLFNRVTAAISGVRLHDFNCGFKAYRKVVVDSIRLYGELHRYIPVLAHAQGFRVTEVPVRHHPRVHGVSKYGWRRYLRGFLDLLTVVATTRYLARPAHLFGSVGALIGGIGISVLAYLTVLWVLGHGPIGNRPLFFLGILCVLLSAQLVSFGLLAEILNRRGSGHVSASMIAESIEPD